MMSIGACFVVITLSFKSVRGRRFYFSLSWSDVHEVELRFWDGGMVDPSAVEMERYARTRLLMAPYLDVIVSRISRSVIGSLKIEVYQAFDGGSSTAIVNVTIYMPVRVVSARSAFDT